MTQRATLDSSKTRRDSSVSSGRLGGARLPGREPDAGSGVDLAAVERAELTEDLTRSRLVWRVMMAGAVLVAGAEVILLRGMGGSLTLLLAAPFMATTALGAALLVTRKGALSPSQLRLVDGFVYGVIAITDAMMCRESGGFESHLVAGMSCVLVAQGLGVADHWSRAAVRLLATMGIYAWAIAVLTWFSPAMATQYHRPGVQLLFAQQLIMVVLIGAISLASSHASFRARRALLATRVAGRYVLEKRIGKGGMGDVWQAKVPGVDRKVAVKLLRSEGVTPEMLTRFGREISMLTQLQHPNTVRVYDWGASGAVCYYAMELLQGETLKALVAREGPLPPARAVHLLRQAARALAEAHSLGIVHRDVKPDNLLLASNEHDFVKLIDFGIAKSQHVKPGETNVTDYGAVVGTAQFMAPEQVMGSQVDARADVYALGAVLYFALTGAPPFAGTANDMMRAHVQSEPKPLEQACPVTIPEALAQVVRRCMHKLPMRRYLSGKEVDQALAHAMSPGTAPVLEGDDDVVPTVQPLRPMRAYTRIVVQRSEAPARLPLLGSMPPTERAPQGSTGD